MKNKTLYVWLALALGPLGVHRFYLRGLKGAFTWVQVALGVIGLYGWVRVWRLGQNDTLSWALMPLLGLGIAIACLQGIIGGLMSADAWNAAYNPEPHGAHKAGSSSGWTVTALAVCLIIGGTALLSGIAIAAQYYFQ